MWRGIGEVVGYRGDCGVVKFLWGNESCLGSGSWSVKRIPKRIDFEVGY